MATSSLISVSEEEYLRIDSAALRRSEYVRGEMFEVEAASDNHSNISTNLTLSVESRLRAQKSPCRTNSQDLRVFLPANRQYAYPDFLLTCGEKLFAPHNTLLNPILIAEILSPTTEDFDLGKKFEWYRSIHSLKEYWTISSDRIHVQQWAIHDGHWTLSEHNTRQSTIIHPHFELTLDEIYFEVGLI